MLSAQINLHHFIFSSFLFSDHSGLWLLRRMFKEVSVSIPFLVSVTVSMSVSLSPCWVLGDNLYDQWDCRINIFMDVWFLCWIVSALEKRNQNQWPIANIGELHELQCLRSMNLVTFFCVFLWSLEWEIFKPREILLGLRFGPL